VRGIDMKRLLRVEVFKARHEQTTPGRRRNRSDCRAG
jgi:hypothetical protein